MNYPGGAFEASTPSSEQYSTNFPVMSKIFSNSDHPNSSPAEPSSMLASPHHHHEDLSAQHYHNQQLQTQQYQSYAAAFNPMELFLDSKEGVSFAFEVDGVKQYSGEFLLYLMTM